MTDEQRSWRVGWQGEKSGGVSHLDGGEGCRQREGWWSSFNYSVKDLLDTAGKEQRFHEEFHHRWQAFMKNFTISGKLSWGILPQMTSFHKEFHYRLNAFVRSFTANGKLSWGISPSFHEEFHHRWHAFTRIFTIMASILWGLSLNKPQG